MKLKTVRDLVNEALGYGVPAPLLSRIVRISYEAGHNAGGNDAHAMTISVIAVLLERNILTDDVLEDATFHQDIDASALRLDAFVEKLPAGTSVLELPDVPFGDVLRKLQGRKRGLN